MSEKLSWLGFILLLGAFSAHALDSDGNGIPDEIEASTGADPFSRYAVSAGVQSRLRVRRHGRGVLG